MAYIAWAPDSDRRSAIQRVMVSAAGFGCHQIRKCHRCAILSRCQKSNGASVLTECFRLFGASFLTLAIRTYSLGIYEMPPLAENLLISLTAAIVGALVVPLIEYVARTKRNKQFISDLVGTWKSSYIVEDKGHWVEEEAEISQRHSRFKITGRNNQAGELYEATAELVNGELVGHWQLSTGNLSGNFLLAIRPSGGLVYGYYTGSKETGERVFGAWILGRSPDDVAQGKYLVKTQTVAMANG